MTAGDNPDAGSGTSFGSTDATSSATSAQTQPAKASAEAVAVEAARKASNYVMGANAKPFIPSSNGDNTKPSRINAAAAAFVPAALAAAAARGVHMSTSAPEFVPKGVPPELRQGHFEQGAEPSQAQRTLSYASPTKESTDFQTSSSYQAPGTAMATMNTGFGSSSGAPQGRGGRLHRSPQQQQGPLALSPHAFRDGRNPLAKPFEGAGRKGRMPSQAGGLAWQPKAASQNSGALGRLQHNAYRAAEQTMAQLQMQSYLILAQMPPEMQSEAGVPDTLQQFHSLYPLEDLKAAEEGISQALGVQSTVIKGIDMHDNQAYALRKLSYRQVHPSPDNLAFAHEVIEAWRGLSSHPSLAVPRQSFLCAEMGTEPCVFVAHDYFPGALTLEAAHLQLQVMANGLVQMNTIAEETLWSYLLQFAAALRAVHSAGMACQSSLHTSKVLLASAERLRIGCLGVAEIVAGPASQQMDMAALQREDLLAVGRILLQLACCSSQHMSLDYCSTHFSGELTRVIASLLGHQEAISSCQQLSAALGEHAFWELDTRHMVADALSSQLSQEMENGRLLRLLAKLSIITERADLDAQWAETGDRYLLKLFRDFVFHQCTETGAPILEWGHIVESLYKLDAGVPEKIVLMSRDEASMLVVSYADIKRCIEATFGELQKLSASSRPISAQQRLHL